MEGEVAETQGTGLTDVLKIVEEAPRERLLSLTFQLGTCPEEDIVLVLVLIVLRRGVHAVNKLHALRDKNNNLANCLAEKWHESEDQLEDFRVKCGDGRDEVDGETLADLARVFRVLSEQRLCDTSLRDLAYRRALCANGHGAADRQPLVYTHVDRLREEAKQVCGPQIAEWMCSSRGLQPGSHQDPEAGPDSSCSTALEHRLSQDQSVSNLPSSLQTNSSVFSYPSHLEISLAQTVSCEAGDVTPTPTDPPCNALRRGSEGQVKSGANQPCLVKGERDSKMDAPGFATLTTKFSMLAGQTQNQDQKLSAVPIALVTPEQESTPPPTEKPVPESRVPKQTREEDKSAEEEEEEEEEEEAAIFYSFVILHAPEDVDVAEGLRERFESCGVGAGATFTEYFAVPGKSTLMCIEDAINNSAFTVLLLSRNFNTRLLEVKADSALVNSINNRHKHNTVIPLLPRENALPRGGLPIVLQTLNPLEENKNFERRVARAFSPAKIEAQRRVWLREQKVKKEVSRQEKLRVANNSQRQFLRERRRTEQLEQERFLMQQNPFPLGPTAMPYMPYWGHQFPGYPNFPVPQPPPPQQQQQQQQQGDGDGRFWCSPQGGIHIENAKYIMIGNDSQMNVELSGAANEDDLSDEQD